MLALVREPLPQLLMCNTRAPIRIQPEVVAGIVMPVEPTNKPQSTV